jgi:kynurenine formamidase
MMFHLPDWHSRGGLVGRGVFIDYKRWADKNGIKYSAFESKKITIKEIETIAVEQAVEFRQGDIFIIRSGYTKAVGELNAKQQEEAMSAHRACGVEGTEDSARWFWNKHFSAVAGDAISFEVYPSTLKDGNEGTVADLGGLLLLRTRGKFINAVAVLHQYFLSLFGLPIGELWDLEALSEHCAKVGRYSFLLTSAPLNIPGCIGSPPNALAIF